MRKVLRRFAVALGVTVLVVLVVFGLLQTPIGRSFFARAVSRVASTPDFALTITGLHGLVPFDITAERVDIGDATGTWATLHDFALDLAPGDLLAGRVHLHALTAREVDVARWAGGESTPLPELIRKLHLPVRLAIDRLAIGRLVMAPATLGQRVVATVSGRAASAGRRVGAVFDLHRIDGTPGRLALDLEVVGTVLKLRLDADEPTGLLLDRMLGRTDHLPLKIALAGRGPVSDWRGRLVASAGSKARVAADIMLAADRAKTLGITGTAAVAPLLPADIAPLLGDHADFSARLVSGNVTRLDSLSLAAAIGSLSAHGIYRGPKKPVSAQVRLTLPDLARLEPLLGRPVAGSAVLSARVAGTGARPKLDAQLTLDALRLGGGGARQVTASLTATPSGALDRPQARIDLAAHGRIAGLLPPAGVKVPAALGRDIDWSLAAAAAPGAGTLEVSRLAAKGAGIDLSGAGTAGRGGRAIAGYMHLKIADLRPFSGLLGRRLAGALSLEAEAKRQGTDGFAASLAGKASGLLTGTAAADALLGTSVEFTGSAARQSGSDEIAGRLKATAADATVSGEGRFDAGARRLSARAALDLPKLAPLGAAFGAKLAGKVSAQVTLAGPLDRLDARGRINGTDLAVGGGRLDRLRLDADIADLAAPKAKIDGRFRSGTVEGTLALTAEMSGRSTLVVPHLRLAAADSAIDGKLRIALDSGLAAGSITAKVPDLARWSRLVGTPLAGRLDLAADLSAGNGQGVALRLDGRSLAAGAGRGRTTLGRLSASTRFTDLLGKASGKGQISLADLRFSAGEVSSATVTIDSPRAGEFAFRGDIKGRPLSVALAGDLGVAPGRLDLRLGRLAGSLDGNRLRLARPLRVSRHGADLAFSDLDLRFGPGRLSGSGSLRGEQVALALTGADLPIGAAAQLAGYRDVQGSLGLDARLSGSLRAPRAHFSLDARRLRLGLADGGGLPRLGLAAQGEWNGRRIDLKGRVSGLAGSRIAFDGAAPLLLSRAPLGLSVPADGALSLRLEGSGELSRLAPLLPLEEDRLSGRFRLNLAASGTVAKPQASGQLTLSDGRYQNFATGAVLTGIRAELAGNRDRLTLRQFSAGDGASGTLKASGSLVLGGGAGPSADLSATLSGFRIAARDEAVATASGKISVSGPLASPEVTARLTVDKADLQLPAGLPPSVTTLNVVVVNGEKGGKKGGKMGPSATAQKAAPALPARLDIEINLPGAVFVRGHGLDSNWRGRLKIAGTSAAPRITGTLHVVRGTFEFLGKTFTLTSGSTITFSGGAKPDPVLDITAEVSAADITAQAHIGGLASAPTIKLSSTPAVPQDEILSRLLFNRGVGQISAGEGIQLAAAAATLSGGGPGVLDRLRTGLGLDRLSLGSAPSGPASSILNPSTGSSNQSASGTTLTGGKYVAPGVYVGVSQGLTAQSSKATVQVEVLPHLNVETDVGESGSSGIGLNYQFDY